MYLMCGPRQLFFFQCGPEMPKGWTPLTDLDVLIGPHPDMRYRVLTRCYEYEICSFVIIHNLINNQRLYPLHSNFIMSFTVGIVFKSLWCVFDAGASNWLFGFKGLALLLSHSCSLTYLIHCLMPFITPETT